VRCQYRGEGGKRVSVCSPSPPAARGLPSNFVGQGEAAYYRAALFYSTCGGMVYNTMERMVVLANLASGGTSQRVLYSSRSGFEGGTMETSCLVIICTPARGLG
jgi:hypothetical protein